MLLLFWRFWCVWVCTEAAASHLHWNRTKTAFTLDESTTHGRVERKTSERDSEGEPRSETLAPQVPVGDAPARKNAALLLRGEDATEVQLNCSCKSADGCLKPCQRRRLRLSLRKRAREKRGERPQAEVLPAAMAQEQDPEVLFGLNITDYEEEYILPDFPDSTPFIPLDPRPRRKQVRNPFYPVTAESYGAYAVMFFSALIFTVGIIGNVSVMCIVCHNFYMRSISNSLLANMALWDFTIIFFCLPLVLFHALTKNWLLGDFTCRIVPYLEVSSLGVTTFTLCALCIDRFRAATNVQIYYEMTENWASTTAKLAVIWVGALLLALPELLIHQLVREDGDLPDVTPRERCVVRISTELPDTLYVLGLTYDGARLWWYFGCYFCLPTLFTICCSLVTAQKIRHAERTCVRDTKKQIQLESQMNCTVVALAILYGFCIIPENICNILNGYMAASVPQITLDVLKLVSQLLLFCKSAVTPVLLFSLCQPFTRAFLDCCCCCCDECGAPRSPATASSDADDCATTEMELSPFATLRREASTSTSYAIGTHC